jgi:uncharacterized protein YqeY
MENLVLKIKADMRSAILKKESKKKLILSTLLGEIERSDSVIENDVKTHTDAQVISIIKKMIDSNIITGTIDENIFLKIYLPEEISEEKLLDLIKSYITDNSLSGVKDTGKVMKYLKDNYTGTYDGSVAATLTKSLL